MKSKIFLMFTVGLSLTSLSLISNTGYGFGNEGPSGGDGVRIEDKIYSLDLLEAGLEHSPYMDPTAVQHPNFAKIVESISNLLGPVANPELSTMVASKLVEVARFNKGLAYAVLDTMRSYSWRLVIPALVNVHDEDSVLELENLELVQLASRQVNAIRINRDLWAQADTLQQTALIFHEAIYALIKPVPMKIIVDRQDVFVYRQSSPRVRQIVAELFTEKSPARDARLSELIAPSPSDQFLPKVGNYFTPSLVTPGKIQFSPYMRWSLNGNFQGSASVFDANEIAKACRMIGMRQGGVFIQLTYSKYEFKFAETVRHPGSTYTYRSFKETDREKYIAWDYSNYADTEQKCLSSVMPWAKGFFDLFSQQSDLFFEPKS